MYIADLTSTTTAEAPIIETMEDNLFPVRCQSCGRVIGNKYETFCQRLHEATSHAADHTHDRSSVNSILRDLGVKHPCCKRHFLAQVQCTSLPTHIPLHVHSSKQDTVSYVQSSVSGVDSRFPLLEWKKARVGEYA